MRPLLFLLLDVAITAALRVRPTQHRASRRITLDEVAAWGAPRPSSGTIL